MKEVILLLCGIVIGRQLMAQTFSEWFRQNHTQLKYLAAQIAALRGYDVLLDRGYQIGFAGLDFIGSVKEDDLVLHTSHYEALDLPSPAVRENELVNVIRRYCKLLPGVASDLEAISRECPSAPFDWPLTGQAMAANLRQAIAECSEWIEDLTSDNRSRMNDSERLSRLTAVNACLCKLYGNAMSMILELRSANINHEL